MPLGLSAIFWHKCSTATMQPEPGTWLIVWSLSFHQQAISCMSWTWDKLFLALHSEAQDRKCRHSRRHFKTKYFLGLLYFVWALKLDISGMFKPVWHSSWDQDTQAHAPTSKWTAWGLIAETRANCKLLVYYRYLNILYKGHANFLLDLWQTENNCTCLLHIS